MGLKVRSGRAWVGAGPSPSFPAVKVKAGSPGLGWGVVISRGTLSCLRGS